MSDLTDKQRAFVEEYLQCWNASEAARRAGYAEGSAGVSGCRNIKNAKVREAIEERLAGAAMSADEILWRLGEQARANIDDFVDADKGLTRPNYRKAVKLGKTHLIKKFKVTKQGVEIELHDVQKALELLGRHQALFTDRVRHEGDVNLTWREIVEQAKAEGDGDEDEVNA